ncbi:hypothetical protein TVAG_190220 [Trichomonas vaginalis G3]|uniref:Uncharacterized protein n=1 Tax=Trichomonas vaginalis (strain ATCC PRA-98 / G3) TaxID=412133 RepID=A2DKF1_TRIV3|nr:biological adhesion protein [Trichomonas vaginalis G3]EAY19128.1 hypothetical protein TVAG_190220 [Trichomonas vaginalis G3]KAI5490425.1 biological adhesion protein [Trichomonas vaginalis G3]|eukprot:XP_001580114.1 hypothetical protein [Trichomonas vaginalis G3]
MKKKDEKFNISFETEGSLSEEVEAIVKDIESNSADDPKIAKYLFGFRKTYELFHEIYHKNVTLLEKTQEMNAHIITNATKIKAILDAATKDKDSLNDLKDKYEEATKIVSSSFESEQNAKKMIQSLRTQISQLSEQVHRGEAFSFGTDVSIFEVSNEVNNLRKEKQNADEEIKTFQDKIAGVNETMTDINKDIDKFKSEENKLNRVINNVQNQLEELQKSNEETTSTIIDLQPIVKQSQQQVEENNRNKTNKTNTNQQLKQEFYDCLSKSSSQKEELRNRKDKNIRRVKVLNEIKHKIVLRTEEKDHKMKVIANCEDDKGKLIKSLETLSDETIQLESDYNQQCDQLKHIGELKGDVRKEAKALRQKYLDTTFKINGIENNIISTQRQMSEVRGLIRDDRSHSLEEQAATVEEKSKALTLKSDTYVEKSSLQQMKEKILSLFQEIDVKRSEAFQIQAKILATNDYITTTNKEYAQHQKEFEHYQDKNAHQLELSEQMRLERNNYKRALESVEKENEELSAQCTQLENNVRGIISNIHQTTEDIFTTHFKSQAIKGEQKDMENSMEYIKKMQQQTERIISRLNAERQTQMYILHEAENDHNELLQEHQVAIKHFEILRDEKISRLRKIEELRSNIETDEALMQRSKKLYQEKLDEIKTLRNELDNLNNRTEQLEKKCEHVKQLKYSEKKISIELMLETHKTMTLVHEFAVPRNVHRWDALEAVDPGYVKNLRYRMSLFAKLDEAHRELETLNKEKEELIKNLKKADDKTSKALTVQQVNEYISKYEKAIADKDFQLKEMQQTAKEKYPQIFRNSTSLEKMREKVNARKSSASVLHTRNTLIQSETNGMANNNDKMFFTEAESYIPTLGGGFVGKVKTPTFKPVHTDLSVYGQSRPQTRQTAILSPQRRIGGAPLPPLMNV